MNKFLIVGFLFLSSCSLFQKKEVPVKPSTLAAEEAHITNSEILLGKERYEEARILFKEFQGLYPQSVYFESARLGEAQSLEGLEKWSEAAELDRDIANKTRRTRPQIAAQAYYRMSFALEALGDDSKAVAALLDAKSLSEYLAPEIALAEIPARLATIYGRQGRDSEAVAYLNEAEKGLATVREQKGKDVKNSWLTKTYMQMGSVSTNQLSADTYLAFLEGQILVQGYLIKALSLNDAEWSPKALNRLKETFRDLYTQVEALNDNRELQGRLGGRFLDIIDHADLYKPVFGSKLNTYEESFFSYLSEVKKKTDGILYTRGETMGLTQESQKLNSLKRAGRVEVNSLLPEEQKSSNSLPPKVVPSEDPNL